MLPACGYVGKKYVERCQKYVHERGICGGHRGICSSALTQVGPIVGYVLPIVGYVLANVGYVWQTWDMLIGTHPPPLYIVRAPTYPLARDMSRSGNMSVPNLSTGRGYVTAWQYLCWCGEIILSANFEGLSYQLINNSQLTRVRFCNQ